MDRSDTAFRKLATALFIVLGLACWPILTDPSAAQQTEVKDQQEKPKTAAQKPAAIPSEGILRRAEALETRVHEIEKAISSERIVQTILKSLPATKSQISSRETKLDQVLAGSYEPSDLAGLHAGWKDLSDQLSAKEKELSTWAKDLNAWVGEIRSQIEVWNLTQTAAQSTRAPEALLSNVGITLGMLTSAEQRLELINNEVLDIQAQVANQQRSVKAALDRIEGAQSRFVESFFVRQQEPLWRIRPSAVEIQREATLFARALGNSLTPALDYVTRFPGRLITHALVIVGLFLAIRWAGCNRPRHAAPHKAGEGCEHVDSPPDLLAHPWPSALLMGLSLTRFLQPAAPNEIRLLLGLLWFAAWLRGLELFLPAGRRAPLYGFAVFVSLILLQDLMKELQILHLLLSLTVLALALTGTLWLRRSGWLNRIPLGGIWPQVLKGWNRLAMVGLAFGLPATVLGYLNLGNTLGKMFIYGSLLGAVLLAGVRILEAIVECAFQADALDRLNVIRMQRDVVLAVVSRGLRALAFFAWVYVISVNAGLWSPLLSACTRMLSVQIVYGAFRLSLGSLLAFGLTLWISWLISRFASFALYHEVLQRIGMKPGVPFAASRFIRYIILIVGVVVAITNLGIPFDRIALMISALGVGIGFGLQQLARDIVSGIVLLVERPIRDGDWVQMDDMLCVVTRIGIRASMVRTTEGAEVVLPNGHLVSVPLTNWTLSNPERRLAVQTGVAYGTNPEQVLDILLKVAQSHPDVLASPAPRALFKGFGDSSLDFELRVWVQSTKRGWRGAIESDLRLAISAALTRAGIEIPYPQRDLHLRSIAPGLRPVTSEAVETDRQGEPESARREDGQDKKLRNQDH